MMAMRWSAAVLLMLMANAPTLAQDYPGRPVTIEATIAQM